MDLFYQEKYKLIESLYQISQSGMPYMPIPIKRFKKKFKIHFTLMSLLIVLVLVNF